MIRMHVTINLADDVLKIMHTNKLSNIDSLRAELHRNKIILHDFEVESILIKLLEDKLIFKTNDGNYAITVGGRMFIECGGYKSLLKTERRKKLKDNINIWAGGIGTALAGIYGLFEIVRWAYHHFH